MYCLWMFSATLTTIVKKKDLRIEVDAFQMDPPDYAAVY
jgi:hypothetical protein